jgi:ubiquitin-like domain-containing CTD phosphatase 1
MASGDGAGASAASALLDLPMLAFEISFSGERHALDVPQTYSVGDLKDEIEQLTTVRAEGQKLIGLPKAAEGDATLLIALTGLKRPQKIMLMGTRDADLAALQAAAAVGRAAGVVDDLEDVGEDEPDLDVHVNPAYAALVEKRLGTFKPHVVAGFRPGAHCLVLDIDYTLLDHRTTVSRPTDMARPFLHFFLRTAYHHGYDIVIWSATSLSWAQLKMRDLGVTSHPEYKIAGFMHRHAMITVEHPRYGRVEVKPLGVLWGMFPEFTKPATTIMFDDLRRNFLMNPANGLKITACRDMPSIRGTDRELLHLACYLAAARRLPSLTGLRHSRWRDFLRREHGYDVEAASEDAALALLARLPSLPALPEAVGAAGGDASSLSSSSSSSAAGAGGSGDAAGR